MSLYQDGSGLPSKNHYTDEDTLRKYENAIHDSFIKVFGEEGSERFKDHAKKIVDFEKVLKAAEMDPEDIQDETKTYSCSLHTLTLATIRLLYRILQTPFPWYHSRQ